jgi:hypothetical protein
VNVTHSALAEVCRESYQRHTTKINDIEVLIKNINGVQVVAFRGTEATGALGNGGWVDILRDLWLRPKRDKRVGWGHAGFISGGLLVMDKKLRKQLNPNAPVICTGHSLGAALAQVCALGLSYHGFNVTQWVGFGAPRVFAGKRDWGNIKLASYKNGNDIVPTWLPPGLLYRHPVAPKNIGRPSQSKANWDDHDINLYVNELGKLNSQAFVNA